MNRRCRFGWVLLLTSACGGAELEGARAIAPETEPAFRRSDEFLPVACRNEVSGLCAPPPVEVVKLNLTDGQDAVVERRLGYDTVLVSNAFDAGPNRVFQYVSDDGKGRRLLHALSFPKLGGVGEWIISDLYELESGAAGFRGRARRVTMRCTLRPATTASLLDTSRVVE